MKTLQQLIGIAVLAITLNSTQAHSWLTNGLVAYYPFNGNANDESGNGNSGTIYNADILSDRFGLANSAMGFGVNKYIEVPSSASLLFSNNLTISAWIKLGGICNCQYSIVSKIFNDGWTGGFDFVYFGDLLGSGSDGIVLEGEFSQGTEAGSPPPHGWAYANISRTTQWRQVTMVHSNQMTYFWVDGLPVTSVYNTALGGIGQSSIPLRIGRRQSPNDNWFPGSIDDIRIYNRALSGTEVQQLYQLESGPRLDFVRAVKPAFSKLTIGTNYQLQVSGDLNAWTNHGTAFQASSTNMIYPQYWDVENWGSLYFRLQVMP